MTSFEKVAREFISSRLSFSTRLLYSNALERWLLYCNSTDPTKPDPAVVTGFRDALLVDHAPLTVRRILSSLSGMYKRAVVREVVPRNPFDEQLLPRPPPSSYAKTEILTAMEVDKILAAVDGDGDTSSGTPVATAIRDRTIILLLYHTGLRISSVLGLRRDKLREDCYSMEIDGRTTLVKALAASVPAKKRDDVKVWIPTVVVEPLNKWLEIAPESKFVFPGSNGQPLARRVINKRLAIYGRMAGVKHVHPHRFRASYITSALDAHVPLNDVQAAVHHEDPKTTQRYDRGTRGVGVAEVVAKFREGKREK